jgi:hypothetical protein
MQNPDPTLAGERPRRVVFLAGETGEGTLRAVVDRHAGRRVDMLVVVPVPAESRPPTPSGAPERAAERRLDRCLAALRAGGIRAEGVLGDADPLLALDNTLRLFPAEEILIASSPAGTVVTHVRGFEEVAASEARAA